MRQQNRNEAVLDALAEFISKAQIEPGSKLPTSAHWCRADCVTCAFTMDRLVLNRGQKIGLVPDLARVHMFDKITGRRL